MEANLFSNTRIEAYVRVSFCGSQAITSVVCVRGRARLAPEFNEELWLPVTEPTETRRISVGLWNYSSHTRDRPIAHLYFDLDDIERSSKYISGSFLGGGLLEQNNYMGPRPRWYNLYGAPIRIQGKRGALQIDMVAASHIVVTFLPCSLSHLTSNGIKGGSSKGISFQQTSPIGVCHIWRFVGGPR